MRRFFGGRQPLCGTGVTSVIELILMPSALSAASAMCVASAQVEEFALSLRPRQIEGKLLQLFGISIEVKAEALFKPEHIGNQRRTLFIDFVAVQQPQQRDQQHQKQTHLFIFEMGFFF